MTDKTGRPMMRLRIYSPRGPIDFIGNIWEINRQQANAKYWGYKSEIVSDLNTKCAQNNL